MNKVLLINGSPNEHGCTDAALTELADTLRANGAETESVWIGKKPVAGRIVCHKRAETGKCAFQDQTNEIGARIDKFDGIVVGSPVYYGGPTGQVCAFATKIT